jgi:hypothetical protein
VLPLADFQTTTFTAAQAVTTGGHAGVIDDPAWAFTRLDLQPDASPFGGRLRPREDGASGSATTGALSGSGGSFSVTFS